MPKLYMLMKEIAVDHIYNSGLIQTPMILHNLLGRHPISGIYRNDGNYATVK